MVMEAGLAMVVVNQGCLQRKQLVIYHDVLFSIDAPNRHHGYHWCTAVHRITVDAVPLL